MEVPSGTPQSAYAGTAPTWPPHASRSAGAAPVVQLLAAEGFTDYRALGNAATHTVRIGLLEAALLRQLCLHTAFPTEPASSLLPLYLSGESRLVLENYPELGFFRDIVFIFKLLMVPSSEPVRIPIGGWPQKHENLH